MKNTYITLRGNIVPATLAASATLALFTALGFLLLPQERDVVADMRLEPLSQTVTLDDTFTVDVVVESHVPVNAFAGELNFNSNTLEVQSIDYNISIADLWAEKPWYSNGDGTLNFIGGTTRKGGFTGTDKLITITFKAKGEGEGALFIKDAQILQHDGLGTDAPLKEPIDALFTVERNDSSSNLLQRTAVPSVVAIVPVAPPSPDLNGDGKQSIADVSILILNIGSSDPRYDLNQDGKVDIKDFNIVLGAR